MQATLKSTIRRGKLTIPKGTVLDFALEDGRFAMFRGQKVDLYTIPTAAFEMAQVANNAVNKESVFVPFEELEPGMLGSSKEGEEIRILGKAVGQTGYDALVTQFGNVDEITFDQLTNGYDEDEIKALQFIAYSDKDGATHVGFYGADYATVAKVNAATEGDDLIVKPFEDVIPTDVAVDKDGATFTILGKGIGKVWFEKTVEAYSLEDSFDEIEATLEEGETGDDIEFILVKDDKGVMSVKCYCPEKGAAVKIEKLADDPEHEAAIESIMAEAQKRWENGGAELYARLQAQVSAGNESITICEEDETVRQNLEHELSENNIAFTKDEDKIIVDDGDDNVEFLAGIAPIYPSVKAGLAEIGIECQVIYKRN